VASAGCPLVLVEWLDARQPEPGWVRLANLVVSDGPVKCVSVGWLLYDGPDKKMLAPNMADVEDEQNIHASGIVHIPSACITRVVRVEEKD
jgi:hypothetical protein